MSRLYSSTNDLKVLRDQLTHTRGQQFWRSLNELADTDEFRDFLHREFPHGASEMNDLVSRRTFFKLMGASMALAGLTGCAIRQPQEQVAPYARAPINQVPGIPLYYATSVAHNGYATGVVVESHDGRPTKIEGNPSHPASLGATDIFAQAEILMLYDPDRPRTVLNNGGIDTWEGFLAAVAPVLQVQGTLEGAGMRILTEPITSPTLADQLQQLLAAFPAARWYQYDPVGQSNAYAGAQLAFGEYVQTRYRFDQASVIVSLDGDFLSQMPGNIPYARGFADGRRIRGERNEMNRLYVAEPTFTLTGMMADHRLPLAASQIEHAARYIANALGATTPMTGEVVNQEWLDTAVSDLQANIGQSVVVVGESQPPIVHALGHAINQQLAALGRTIEYTDPVIASPSDSTADLRMLTEELRAGEVDVLFVLGANPVYTAPADLDFADAMSRAKFSAVSSYYPDETAVLANWFIPSTHSLETWSDLRAYDGTASIVQPLILPLYQGHSAHDVLAGLLGQSDSSGYDTVRAYWQAQVGEDGFDTFWQSALNAGIITDTAYPLRPVNLQIAFLDQQPTERSAEGFELLFQPDPTIWDGRYANNGWLQELPKPVTKLTWDNAALVSPRTAIQLFGIMVEDETNLQPKDLEGLQRANGQMVEVQHDGRSLTLPIWIVPGQVDNTVVISLGYGRTNVGQVGEGTGFNAYQIRTSDAPWFVSGVAVADAGDRYQLVSTQDHSTMEGRDLVRVGNVQSFRENPLFLSKGHHGGEGEGQGEHTEGAEGEGGYEQGGEGESSSEREGANGESLMPDVTGSYNYRKYNAWGMTIDLNVCISCNACTIACQAENNIPVVGKAQVAVGREMHWIRIDRYFAGDSLDNPATYIQPVPCMQCEQAPCEVVCPVAATVHDHEGINNMVYNRCVGTKYCSNNCPYKVRRFNFFQYQDLTTPSLKLMRNPDVTVRNRGVMEKCNYCAQRISHARIEAKKAALAAGVEDYRVLAGDAVVTACQQVCPTNAIVFGDINNSGSQVAQTKAEPLNYVLLEELNTKPRTSYLARLRNPNPALASGEEAEIGA